MLYCTNRCSDALCSTTAAGDGTGCCTPPRSSPLVGLYLRDLSRVAAGQMTAVADDPAGTTAGAVPSAGLRRENVDIATTAAKFLLLTRLGASSDQMTWFTTSPTDNLVALLIN
mmetsp:Transcript_39359/g.70422  ORF Transcript_39359/g.70422 Transcript_39359/m.70422 type:complete len:114 (-) Transcript_39359:24-365(-)|eukprot:CAMPEP_0206387594 /NCGR_PEP_ID=MMETSP0294-20121207/16720_1 /ASSEMBLY_ACC=CAM_ASM_000327 /TAXON_ID=39354 /ORGANISM="Heterosigma akashiwo, Strain CCMP2393" /LENGTH=113 /DNA_ID=CAMNT_0053839039 /DNA_START=92 /DNA_END=433 /DNA_ORIENTATION=+